MRYFLLSFFCTMSGACMLTAQVLYQENFEANGLPAGWSVSTLATDGGWKIGTPAGLSSQYFTISSNGSLRAVATNDDACNCDKSKDYLITPPLNLSSVTSTVLKADIFFGAGNYQGITERGTIEVSLDKVNWTELATLHGHGGWDQHLVDLSAYAGKDSVYVAFHYDDNGGFLYGMAIDNVSIEVPFTLDAALTDLHAKPYGLEIVENHVSGVVFNNGVTPITSLEIAYMVDGGIPVATVVSSLSIAPFAYYEFHHPTPWTSIDAGIHNIQVSIVSVNGIADENVGNNVLSFETEIFPDIVPPNIVDQFLQAAPIYTTVATAANQLSKPNDVDFFPILAKNELWVVNERTEALGGSTLTIYDAGKPSQTFLNRVDGNAWHFMSLPTGIAFSEDNFNFSTSPGVKDANHNGGSFTGPALWSSDPNIYAQPSGGNGSHLDMLHGSPYSMGIAHEADNIFWVFDGWNETIVRYDFGKDHGPGNDDHADGIVRRYLEIPVKKDGFVPSHLVLDKTSGWLYVVDNGNDRVLRLNINSGSVANALPLINEPLAEHSEMGNVTWEVIINQGLSRPSGIEIIGNRLLVSDFANGDIIVYDIENGFAELGRIATGQAGITGIKIGPEGEIWYTNRTQNTLKKIVPGEVSNTEELAWAAQVQVSPNPTSGNLLVRLPESSTEVSLELTNLLGEKLANFQGNSNSQSLSLRDLPNGIYLLSISSKAFSTTRKIVLEK
ncbi:MAG: choice-of-anchor J domain-containing protein [Saprospiraceae bacterium]|nr:choice-of-anchor J domain-containing protein [Saprospiraceae bacterium]